MHNPLLPEGVPPVVQQHQVHLEPMTVVLREVREAASALHLESQLHNIWTRRMYLIFHIFTKKRYKCSERFEHTDETDEHMAQELANPPPDAHLGQL